MRPSERAFQSFVFLTRWLVAPFILGLLCCVLLLIYRFFADFYALALRLPSASWHDLLVGVLDLVDITLVANLILIVVFAAYQNYIRKIDTADQADWPPGLIDVDFSALKQKLLASIAAVAAVDALAWYLDLETFTDTAKLGWALAFPLMFVVAMVLLAIADWLSARSSK